MLSRLFAFCAVVMLLLVAGCGPVPSNTVARETVVLQPGEAKALGGVEFQVLSHTEGQLVVDPSAVEALVSQYPQCPTVVQVEFDDEGSINVPWPSYVAETDTFVIPGHSHYAEDPFDLMAHYLQVCAFLSEEIDVKWPVAYATTFQMVGKWVEGEEASDSYDWMLTDTTSYSYYAETCGKRDDCDQLFSVQEFETLQSDDYPQFHLEGVTDVGMPFWYESDL